MSSPGDEESHARTLHDLPRPVLEPLLRAFRRAADDLPRGSLPAALRPFAGWRPERLHDPRARGVLASALVSDPVLREAVAERLDVHVPMEEAATVDVARLTDSYGEGVAVAALVVAARWGDLATLAARLGEEEAVRGEVAAERATGPPVDERPFDDRDARREAEEAGRLARRAQAAEERARKAEERLAEVAAELEATRQRLDGHRERAEVRRRRDRSRIARLKEQLRHLEARPVIEAQAAARVADELEALAGSLRQPSSEPSSEPAPPSPSAGPPVPREPPSAEPGRPCILPRGLSEDSADGVRSLLRVPGIRVLLDGYNLTLDTFGRAGQRLTEQRRWLTGLAGSAAARFGAKPVVVFDSSGGETGAGPSARDVLVLFTAADETADDRIVEIAAALDPGAPVLVVTSDQELGERASALDANVVRSEAFLKAVDG